MAGLPLGVFIGGGGGVCIQGGQPLGCLHPGGGVQGVK